MLLQGGLGSNANDQKKSQSPTRDLLDELTVKPVYSAACARCGISTKSLWRFIRASQAEDNPESYRLVVWCDVEDWFHNHLKQAMRYLVNRITGLSNVEVLTRTQISGLEGAAGMLQAVRWRQGASGEEVRRPIHHLFLFIGADPNTDWLAGSGVALDPKGFVLTGAEVGSNHHLLETSCPGVFAIGDVRSGSVKRVAASVGEGAQVVAALQGFLAASGREQAVVAAH
jgi:Pyridine nucleotide-disulphide oxidoreductase